MLKIFWLILCIILVSIIFTRTPQNTGLASLATKTNLLGSPSSTERSLNKLTFIGIIIFYLIALQLNQSTVN